MNSHMLHLAVVLVSVVLMTGCGLVRPGDIKTAADFGSTAGLTADPILQEKAIAILETNCASCHLSGASGGLSQINNPSSLVRGGWITPGIPGSSKIYMAIANAQMPPAGALNSNDQQVISDWITSMSQTGPIDVDPGPGPTPTPTPTPPVDTSTLEGQAVALLTAKCVGCHGANGSGGVNRINEPDYLKSAGLVVAMNPAGSRIYAAASAGRMPPTQALTSAELKVLSDWILAGANAPAGGVTPPPPPPFPTNPTFTNVMDAVITPRCVSCHRSGNAQDGVRLDTYNEVLKQVNRTTVSSSKILRITKSGEMPPSPSSDLEQREIRLIEDWIAAGALQN